jgi:Tfp pilus assembly protein PilF
LILLGIVLVLILVFVAFAITRNQPTDVQPTLAVVQNPATVVVTLPPAPSVVSPTHIPTQPPSLSSNQPPPHGQGQNPSQGEFVPPPVPTMYYPQMPADQARDAISHDQNNPGAYLALIRDQLQNNDVTSATRTYEQGLSHVRDTLPFQMTAASIAVDVGQYNVAFALFAAALQDSQNQAPYPAVRAQAGEFLYDAATLANRLTLQQIRDLSTELVANHSPIVDAMIGRAFLANDNPRLAQASIASALKIDDNLAEAHLVNGEYEQAQGNLNKARSEWQLALDALDAPKWVHDRATTLLNANSAN